MTKHDIDKWIGQCIADIEQVQELLKELQQIDPASQYEPYKAKILLISMRSEAIAIKIRQLVMNTAFCSKQHFYQDIAQAQGIIITSTHDWIKIMMPFLLPSKGTQKYNCDFITEPLAYALAAYVKEIPTPKYDDCVLAFRHIYTEKNAAYVMRDHDNIETKKVIDVITSYLLVDDGGNYCSHFYTSALGEREQTEVYVMEGKVLKYWLEFA